MHGVQRPQKRQKTKNRIREASLLGAKPTLAAHDACTRKNGTLSPPVPLLAAFHHPHNYHRISMATTIWLPRTTPPLGHQKNTYSIRVLLCGYAAPCSAPCTQFLFSPHGVRSTTSTIPAVVVTAREYVWLGVRMPWRFRSTDWAVGVRHPDSTTRQYIVKSGRRP